MPEHYHCRHGLTLAENCDACEIEMAMEKDRRFGPIVDEARKVIAEKESQATPQEQKI